MCAAQCYMTVTLWQLLHCNGHQLSMLVTRIPVELIRLTLAKAYIELPKVKVHLNTGQPTVGDTTGSTSWY